MAITGPVLGGRYRLLDLLGAGASAQVFLAEDRHLHRRVAVKVLHPGLAGDDAFLARFRAEARATAALSHPNLLAVHDWGEGPDGPYLVLEHLAGGSLRDMLDHGARLSPSQALDVGLQAARGLVAAHRSGLVHRDIKPANLLFGDDGRLRIADFGVARALSEAGVTQHDGLVGTARYAAPEQARTSRVDGRADVYSLALVLVEAVTGRVLLARDEALATLLARADEAPAVPDELGPLGPVLARALRPDPADRPGAAELVDALLAAAPSLPRPAPLPLVRRPEPDVRPDGFGDDDEPGGIGDVTTGAGASLDATVSMAPVRAPDPTGVLPEAPAGRRRRRWPWAVLAAVVVAAAVTGAVLFANQVLTPSAEVPGVVELTVEEAQRRIDEVEAAEGDGFGWRVEVVEDFHDVVPPGSVVSQAPAAGTDLKDGKVLQLVVSRGPVPVPLPPDLEGQAETAAAAALGAAQLTVGEVTRQHHEEVEKGRVITWSAGDVERPAEAPKGPPIDLVVSDGPAPRTIENLAGRTPEEAEAALRAKDLEPKRTEVFSATVEKGRVVGTSPAAGENVARGSEVTIRISKGPELVAVPDVARFRSLDEAKAALEVAGLRLGNVSGNGSRPFATDPEKGTQVPKNTEVDVYLRR